MVAELTLKRSKQAAYLREWRHKTGFHKKYYAKNRKKLLEQQRRYRAEHPEIAERRRELRHNNPELYKQNSVYYNNYVRTGKNKARMKVYRAVRSGKLVRPTNCSRCGVPCTPVAHHSDYEKPLDIVWLCRKCHGKQHETEV